MLTKALIAAGLRGWHMHASSLATIYLCITLWIRAKTVDQEERGNAERRALFVGLWPPMFWLIGDSLQAHEQVARSRLVAGRSGRRRTLSRRFPRRMPGRRGSWSVPSR
jgi:hypothetical protein